MSFADFRASFEDKPRSSGGGNFTGVRIPFFSVPEGKSRVRFLSDLPIHEVTGKVPNMELYRYYKPEPNGKYNGKPAYILPNGKPSYEFAYHEDDEIEPGYVAKRKADKKRVDPARFPYKGFAYVQNLTGLKVVRAYLAHLAEGKPAGEFKVTSTLFGRDVNEAAAGRAFFAEYKKAVKDHEEKREELLNDKDDPKDIGEFVYHGIYIYNFNLTVAKQLNITLKTLEADGYEEDEIHLPEWVFALTKSGTGMDTEYGFTLDFPADELDDELLQPTYDFLEGLEEGLSTFEGLIDRKRFKDPEELEEEHKVSNLSKDAAPEAVPTGDWRN